MLADPEPCTVIEEVGSTGVGAMALAFIIMAVATVIFLSKAWNNPEHKRLKRCKTFERFTILNRYSANYGSYYLATSYLAGIGSIIYFAMLSGEGWTTVTGCRQFFWIR